ncbi:MULTISPECIES: phage head closure protein [unclassified Sphingobium]|uniref:phage head closure protein n=1 Tax=unclassified Sphingobium TaxID=2611147 RepID=UPI002223F688|nr:MULTISPECIES: phage head closure protein [unclassified Sphingobium]MCW2412931.1 SPP1 family predicted phage head-tail adaptor [Sphingobium sp. B8D3D]MCW2414771.1 SPP1 family predicted phage head-tail adaptor [Sphingobium sp. B8D3A]
MKAGDLKERIAITAATSAQNAIGEVVEGSHATIATVWAAKWTLTSKDIARAASAQQQTEAKFAIRYRDGVSTSNRIVHKGTDYQILSIEEFEDGWGLYLFVRSLTV